MSAGRSVALCQLRLVVSLNPSSSVVLSLNPVESYQRKGWKENLLISSQNGVRN